MKGVIIMLNIVERAMRQSMVFTVFALLKHIAPSRNTSMVPMMSSMYVRGLVIMPMNELTSAGTSGMSLNIRGTIDITVSPHVESSVHRRVSSPRYMPVNSAGSRMADIVTMDRNFSNEDAGIISHVAPARLSVMCP